MSTVRIGHWMIWISWRRWRWPLGPIRFTRTHNLLLLPNEYVRWFNDRNAE